MLALAAERARGVHTYNATPEHTAIAREALSADAWLCVEQKVLLGADTARARATGANMLKFYQRTPGYRNNWNRLGFTDEDIDQMSDRFVDAMVAWGDEPAIRRRRTVTRPGFGRFVPDVPRRTVQTAATPRSRTS